jgi:hypothetical protein
VAPEGMGEESTSIAKAMRIPAEAMCRSEASGKGMDGRETGTRRPGRQ